ncbi:DivIVA domain-containing protein [Microbacterium sp. ARD31]|uniref:DivIVA domain-containing protein n=1 Tax=Microbacterium sp. ARD31 TaxID=2962576 RepID=UPI0028811839|nr:DivIVA domain-containing protein [Microbacterium sp. ARD31]MDT0183523.1 DivIVA domain-containing protein [Microbacterium sp. ARD31]
MLERPSFSTTSMREGYDTDEVDRAVDLIFDNLALPEPRFGADQITSLRFTPVRLQQGYDMGEVDSWLDLAAAETESRSADGAEPAQQPADAPPAPAEPAPISSAPSSSTAITEVKAGGAGLYVIVLGMIVILGVLAYVLLG